MSLKKFDNHQGIAAPLLRDNIDTDAIIPSREMKAVSKHGLGEGLFAGWRYTAAGGREPNPDFVLNQDEYRNASILLGGSNFGCGSSREHAVWALKEFGVRAVVAPSFGSIFFGNCISNGVLPVVLPDETIERLARKVEADPQVNQLQIDLRKLSIRCDDIEVHFSLEDGPRHMLLNGLDPIDATLLKADSIAAFEAEDRKARPWAYL